MSGKHQEPHDAHSAADEIIRRSEAETGAEARQNAEAQTIDAPAAAGPKAGSMGDDCVARVAGLEAEVASLRAELSETNDKYLRKLADDVNFRKRMAREKEDGQRFAVAALLGDIVPVLDDFDRAIASSEVAKDYSVLHDGVALIKRQLGQVLELKYGLVRLETVGKSFDPNRHEAVAVEQGGDCDEPVVAEEFLPGYMLHDRMLRTAKVRVRMPATQGGGASDATAEGGSASN